MPNPPPQSLPASWVDEIFRRLTMTYGHLFLGRWSGIDMADVKADWGQKLAGMTPEAIAYALDNLPADNPPNALQFRALGRRPEAHQPAALPPPIDRDGLRRIAAEARKTTVYTVTKAELIQRHERRLADGQKLSAAQRDWLDAAKREEPAAAGSAPSDWRPIADSLLPPLRMPASCASTAWTW